MGSELFYEFLLPLLREAGKLFVSAHEVDNAETVSTKAGVANFVTVYDVKVQRFLLDSIKQKLPNAYFIAEEQENDPAALQHACCFMIDPIDGTTNFIRDYHHSCISLALFSHGELIFGAVYDPYLDEMFYAEKGKGAFLNGKPIHVSDRPLSAAIIAYGTAAYDKPITAEATFGLCKELYLAGADVRRCGSAALDLAYTAAGRNDLFFECRLSPWDVAAGYLLMVEAGGFMTDMNGNALTFTAPSSIIAANPRVYPALLDRAKYYATLL